MVDGERQYVSKPGLNWKLAVPAGLQLFMELTLIGTVYAFIDFAAGYGTLISLVFLIPAVSSRVSSALRKGHVRGEQLRYRLSLLSGAYVLYWSWAFYLSFVFGGRVLTYLNPVMLFGAVWEIFAGGSQAQAIFNVVFWSFETLMLVNIPAFFVDKEGPYCEKGGRWVDRFQPIMEFTSTKDTNFQEMVGQWNLEKLFEAPPITENTSQKVVIEAASCQCCEVPFTAVRAVQFISFTDHEGDPATNTEVVVQPLVVDIADVQLLSDLEVERQRVQMLKESGALNPPSTQNAEPEDPVF